MSEEVKLSKSAKDKEKQAQDEAKLKTLETVLGKIEKTYGKGAVMNMAARPTTDVNVIPTGSINLDHALGVGGYPRGRIIEIYGPESSGKTTLAIHAIAEVQKQGGKAIIIDAEHAFDPSYAEALGVDMDSLYISCLGTRAATESMMTRSTAPERMTCSAMSSACSPLSG